MEDAAVEADGGLVGRILVVDGHEIVREGIRAVLRKNLTAYEVLTASTAVDALQVVGDMTVNLVITELSVRGRAGAELVQDIFNLSPHIPVLVHTACEEKDYGVRAIQSGALGFVSKDAGIEVLVQAVGRLLKGQHFVSPDLAMRLVSFVRQDSGGPPHEILSEREFQVLKRIGIGKQNKEIGSELNLSPKTVATYRTRVLTKLRLKTPADLVRYCIEHSL